MTCSLCEGKRVPVFCKSKRRFIWFSAQRNETQAWFETEFPGFGSAKRGRGHGHKWSRHRKGSEGRARCHEASTPPELRTPSSIEAITSVFRESHQIRNSAVPADPKHNPRIPVPKHTNWLLRPWCLVGGQTPAGAIAYLPG